MNGDAEDIDVDGAGRAGRAVHDRAGRGDGADRPGERRGSTTARSCWRSRVTVSGSSSARAARPSRRSKSWRGRSCSTASAVAAPASGSTSAGTASGAGRRSPTFARQVADEVRASGNERALEPMSPPDRKVVHDTVAELDGRRHELRGRGAPAPCGDPPGLTPEWRRERTSSRFCADARRARVPRSRRPGRAPRPRAAASSTWSRPCRVRSRTGSPTSGPVAACPAWSWRWSGQRPTLVLVESSLKRAAWLDGRGGGSSASTTGWRSAAGGPRTWRTRRSRREAFDLVTARSFAAPAVTAEIACRSGGGRRRAGRERAAGPRPTGGPRPGWPQLGFGPAEIRPGPRRAISPASRKVRPAPRASRGCRGRAGEDARSGEPTFHVKHGLSRRENRDSPLVGDGIPVVRFRPASPAVRAEALRRLCPGRRFGRSGECLEARPRWQRKSRIAGGGAGSASRDCQPDPKEAVPEEPEAQLSSDPCPPIRRRPDDGGFGDYADPAGRAGPARPRRRRPTAPAGRCRRAGRSRRGRDGATSAPVDRRTRAGSRPTAHPSPSRPTRGSSFPG